VSPPLTNSPSSTARKAALIKELDLAENAYEELNVVNALTSIDALGDIPHAWVQRTKKNKKAGEYLKRLAIRLSSERK
jgi:hypothetical protein